MLHAEWQFFSGYLCWVQYDTINTQKEKYYSSNCRWPSVLEIVYFIDGHDEMHIGNKIYTNTADTIRITPPFDKCGDDDAYCITRKSGPYISFHYHTNYPFCTETMVLDASSSPELRNLFIKAYRLWFSKKENYYFKTMCLFYQVLDIIYQMSSAQQVRSDKYKIIELAVNHIHNHYNNHELTCDSLPEMCGIKHSYFNRIFKECFQTTPSKYITNLRMKLATDLLKSKKLSIAEIADQTGYESTAYFCNVFKKHFGMSPSKYLKGRIL